MKQYHRMGPAPVHVQAQQVLVEAHHDSCSLFWLSATYKPTSADILKPNVTFFGTSLNKQHGSPSLFARNSLMRPANVEGDELQLPAIDFIAALAISDRLPHDAPVCQADQLVVPLLSPSPYSLYPFINKS